MCEAVVVSLGKDPCTESVDLYRALDGGSQLFGSGCSEKSTLVGPMSDHLFFWESPEKEGFIVLCDGARVDHIAEFAQAKLDCFAKTKPE